MSEATQTILVVDDIPDNIAVLSNVLSPEFKVQAATSGERVLEIVDRMPPDLILLDVMMPGMNGYEVCRHLHDNEETASIPVIFVTAKSEEHDEAEGLALGAVDYITKPIRPAIVLARVHTHLRLSSMQRRLEKQNQELERAALLRDDVERITRHDLKTPLNNIMAIPRLLMERYQFDEEDRTLLRMVERGASNMLTMINNSLDLYKMETGTYPLSSQPMDLISILRYIVNGECGNKAAVNVRTELRLNGELVKDRDECWANVEEMLCYPMFCNLLSNAFEAAPAGSLVEIGIEDQNDRVLVRLTNEGVVPREIRATFFDKYVTRGKQRGTGLGTYSARLCAETQNGSISMRVLEESRTEVLVTLPGRGSSISIEELRAEIEAMNRQ